MFSKSAALLALLPIAVQAHFKLDFPTARGFDEDTLGTFPCGGQDTVSSNRTSVSMTSFPIALTMGHDEAAVEVLLALGNEPGSNFSVVVKKTFREEGLGAFCMQDLDLSSIAGVAEGVNATIQVITNGDPDGGLYNCADITFTSDASTSDSSCTNGTGVTAEALSTTLNANETTAEGAAQDGSSSTSTSSSSTASSTATSGVEKFAPAGFGALCAAVFAAVALI